MPTIAPSLPLTRDDRFGVSSHTSIVENAKQNLKNLILTNPGERIDPEYGVGLKKYLFENITEVTLENIKDRIASQANTYMPNLRFYKIDVAQSPTNANAIIVTLVFSVSGSSATTLVVST